MASIDRAWDTTHAIGADSSAPNTLMRGETATRYRASGESQFHQVFHYVLMVYLFLAVSRAPELITWLRIGLILQPILLIGLLMTHEAGILTKVRSGRWLMAFTIWVAICVPFSFWPGGSFQTFIKALQALLLVAFFLAFVRSVRDVMRSFEAIGLASGAIAVFSFISPSSAEKGGRQGLEGSATVADPNFYALYLLVGLVFLCLTAWKGRGFLRLCSIALIPISLAGVGHTGSRAGLLTLLTGLVMFLVYGSAKQRTVILSACLVGALLATFYLPASIKTRFTDFFAPAKSERLASDTSQMTVAEASAEARMTLLQRSLLLTAKHPIFGVGPDQFPEAEAEDAGQHGMLGMWHVTHNTYTQMSSECGIPGLIMFAGALFWSYSGLSSLRRRGPTRQIRQMALFLQIAYLMLLVGAFFLALGYSGLPFVMIGLSEAFKLAVRRYVRESRTQILQPEVSLAV